MGNGRLRCPATFDCSLCSTPQAFASWETAPKPAAREPLRFRLLPDLTVHSKQ